LQAEVAELMAKAEAADAADIPDGMSIPDELARREERLRKIAEARTNIEARAKERHAREMAEYEAALATPRLRPRAKSPAASRPSFQPRGLCRAIRLISPTKTRASCSAGDGNLPIWPATDSQRFAWIVPSLSSKGCDPWLYPRGELNEMKRRGRASLYKYNS
jgi:hypothetical protein